MTYRGFTLEELNLFGIHARKPIRVGSPIVDVQLGVGDRYPYQTFVVVQIEGTFWRFAFDHHHSDWEYGDNELEDSMKGETFSGTQVFPKQRTVYEP